MRHLLDVVVLAHDVPGHRLEAGDLGTIVEVYDQGAYEVEFSTMDGRALAVLTLNEEDLREAAGDEVPAVRRAVSRLPG